MVIMQYNSYACTACQGVLHTGAREPLGAQDLGPALEGQVGGDEQACVFVGPPDERPGGCLALDRPLGGSGRHTGGPAVLSRAAPSTIGSGLRDLNPYGAALYGHLAWNG